jgi:hypothetical protein
MNQKADVPVRGHRKARLNCLAGRGQNATVIFKWAFTPHLTKVAQKNLRAPVEFCLLPATILAAQPAMLWQDRAVQNPKPIAIAFQFWPESVGSNPIPIVGSGPPALAASTVAGHAIGELAVRPSYGDFFSCSGIRAGTIGVGRFSKVRNSERRFCLLGSRICGTREERFNRRKIF